MLCTLHSISELKPNCQTLIRLPNLQRYRSTGIHIKAIDYSDVTEEEGVRKERGGSLLL